MGEEEVNQPHTFVNLSDGPRVEDGGIVREAFVKSIFEFVLVNLKLLLRCPRWPLGVEVSGRWGPKYGVWGDALEHIIVPRVAREFEKIGKALLIIPKGGFFNGGGEEIPGSSKVTA